MVTFPFPLLYSSFCAKGRRRLWQGMTDRGGMDRDRQISTLPRYDLISARRRPLTKPSSEILFSPLLFSSLFCLVPLHNSCGGTTWKLSFQSSPLIKSFSTAAVETLSRLIRAVLPRRMVYIEEKKGVLDLHRCGVKNRRYDLRLSKRFRFFRARQKRSSGSELFNVDH